MFYEPESNIFSIELSNSAIEYAHEFGQFIIHFSRSGKPVLIEILDAEKFTRQFEKISELKNLKKMASEKIFLSYE